MPFLLFTPVPTSGFGSARRGMCAATRGSLAQAVSGTVGSASQMRGPPHFGAGPLPHPARARRGLSLRRQQACSPPPATRRRWTAAARGPSLKRRWSPQVSPLGRPCQRRGPRVGQDPPAPSTGSRTQLATQPTPPTVLGRGPRADPRRLTQRAGAVGEQPWSSAHACHALQVPLSGHQAAPSRYLQRPG